MARRISSRLRLYGTLQAETPLHVGGYGVDVDTDLPLARNGKHELYVPGTSITGALRAWCERNFGNVNSLFGFQKDDSGHASFILVEDAIVTLPKNLQTEIRDGVGIDRFYGTAADGAKYDRAILPKGSRLNFEMTVEIKEHEAETKAIIGHLLAALTKGEIRFGASKTRGLGCMTFDLDEIREEQLQGFDAILNLFDGTKKQNISIKELIDADKHKTPNPKKPKLEITIKWKPRLPLMVKAGYEGIGVDMLPVTSGVESGNLALVLAGSSIKGALRSQAERIIRTLLDIEAPNRSDDSQNFSKQLQMADKDNKDTEKARKLVAEMFGAKKERDAPNQPKSSLGLGALSIDDCYSVEEFNQTNWREVEQEKADNDKSANEWGITQALNKVRTEIETSQSGAARKPHFHISHHTAIDRFTGGVADGALYSVLAPHDIEWQKINMSLDFDRTANDKCSLMLLLLVLRDVAENRLPFGFATNRGMGQIEVEWIKLEGQHFAQLGLPKDLNITFPNGDLRQLDSETKNSLKGAWEEWLNK
jgi:CRISPR/Cas system CSM-associated protein Csm3 (group 7 of RAMP superfamily)